MTNQVIKKDGSKEPFDAEKIKKGIRLASQQAGLDEAKQNEITEKVTAKVVEMLKDQEEVRTIEIGEKILGELDLYAPTVSAAWRDYEKSKKKWNKQEFAYSRKKRIINIVRSRILRKFLRCAVDHNKLNVSNVRL